MLAFHASIYGFRNNALWNAHAEVEKKGESRKGPHTPTACVKELYIMSSNLLCVNGCGFEVVAIRRCCTLFRVRMRQIPLIISSFSKLSSNLFFTKIGALVQLLWRAESKSQVAVSIILRCGSAKSFVI